MRNFLAIEQSYKLSTERFLSDRKFLFYVQKYMSTFKKYKMQANQENPPLRIENYRRTYAGAM